MIKTKTIQVLLAAYNGAEFLNEQINSVLLNFDKLSGFDCQLLISDDKSSDDTSSILSDYSEKDSRVRFLDGNRKGGVKDNFNFLIMAATADYIFFCDQDDLWLPNKISIFISKFNEVETSDLPILLHSDLCVSDKNLSPINVSMFAYQKINKDPTFSDLIVSNSVTGCVMAINKSLLTIVQGCNVSKSIMHDWYIALIASAFGKIHFIPSALILYRQHGNNQVGAKSFSIKDGLNKNIFEKSLKSLTSTKKQAEIFLADFDIDISDSHRCALESYIGSFNKSFFNRLHLFITGRVRKYGYTRNIMFLLMYVFFCGKKIR
ncbi:glycosyltransferase family 2 protein [Serratia sp. arafor3]|uniref:Glycosyltransferase family 2 protein n=2 Tax=Serratia silvae TaxID=2824122 RepID=A0ABT0KI04_9GAMM|nr:glycosyltransferase family 2 protein [Serratia silvae]